MGRRLLIVARLAAVDGRLTCRMASGKEVLMDFSTVASATLGGLVADFTANLGPIVVVVIGAGAVAMVWAAIRRRIW